MKDWRMEIIWGIEEWREYKGLKKEENMKDWRMEKI